MGSMNGASEPIEGTKDATKKALQDAAKEHTVVVPDMFASIMAARPVVNPFYHDVKPKADAWVTNKDPVGAQKEVDDTYAVMEDINPPVQREDNPIRYIFQTTWDRLKQRGNADLQVRWKEMHKRFFDGLINQVHCQIDERMFSRDVQEYMDMRRGTIGAYPAIALTEYAVGINLSNEIVNHPSLQECMCVSADLVLLVNDILSYKKDIALGVDHNLIFLLMEQGRTPQEAIDEAGVMLDNCYKRWYIAPANMPIWGEETDRQVLKFVDACRNVALGNLYWSFKTGRYLGPQGDQVHETRVLNLPPMNTQTAV
ncbi:MAG: hypothetical protein L6R37_001490 [Teloschistes peruensis]|nr:MAG: hypothetical protein L6R37_001490 [Teloschistes peruensis]